MTRFKTISLIAALIAPAAACSNDQEGTERTKISGGYVEFSEPAAAELPLIELHEIEEEGFSLASCSSTDKNCKQAENQKLWDTLMLAGKKIQEGVYSGNNVYAAGVEWSNRNGKTVSRCIKVQIQQRNGGKVVVKDTLVPAGQAEECKVDSVNGLSGATLAIFAKIAGNNYAAGIGIGAVLYQQPYLVGCAAGAVGYVSETFQSSYGTAGAFCTQIYDTVTGATY